MVDATEAIGKARAAVAERADLPGMSLMEHLDELRKRIVHSAAYLLLGLSWLDFPRSAARLSPGARSTDRQIKLRLHAPHGRAEPGSAGCLARRSHPRLALHPLPGMALHRPRPLPERKALRHSVHGRNRWHCFLLGASFGYFFVLPGAMKILIVRFGINFTPMVTIEEYSRLLSVHHPRPRHQLRNANPHLLPRAVRHRQPAVSLEEHPLRHPGRLPGGGRHLPSPDPWTMCIYAVPMLALYLIGIGVAWWVHPSREEGQRGCGMTRSLAKARVILSGAAWGPTQWGKRSEGSAFVFRIIAGATVSIRESEGTRCCLLLLLLPFALPAQQHFNGARAYEYARAFAAIGPRWPTGPGHVKAEAVPQGPFPARSA